MSSYLDQYGAGEERRNQILGWSIAGILIAAVLGLLGWYLTENHHQESVIKAFARDLRSGDFQSAYRDWGCTATQKCSGYSFDNFMQDWGSKGNGPDPAVIGLTDSESCNNGVILTLRVNSKREDKLWLDRDNDRIGFAPYPICPHKSPFAIMAHRTVGQLRKPLLH
jgi:hypothetical protein